MLFARCCACPPLRSVLLRVLRHLLTIIRGPRQRPTSSGNAFRDRRRSPTVSWVPDRAAGRDEMPTAAAEGRTSAYPSTRQRSCPRKERRRTAFGGSRRLAKNRRLAR